jgi:hypothetical protein
MGCCPAFRKTVLTMALLFACATPAAQASRYNTQCFSLDWIVQASDLVVLATITHREELPTTEQQRWQTPHWFRLTAKISETFKGGPAPPEVTFLAFDGEPGPRYFSLPSNGSELVLGLSRTNRWQPWPASPWVRDCPTAAAPFFLTTQAFVPPGGRADYFVGAGQFWDAYAIDWIHADVVPINGRENILTALRRISAESTPGADSTSGGWCLDWEPEHHWRFPAGWDFVRIPADQRLKTAAEQWVRSPDPAVRQRGALFLANFPGPQTIGLWKRLLEDPFRITDADRPYPIREQAHLLLAGTGVTLPMHTLDAPMVETRPIPTSHLLIVGSALALGLAMILFLRRSRRQVIRRSLVLPTVVGCIAGLLWMRSAKTIDVVHLRLGSARLELSTWAGSLHCIERPQAITDAVAAYGSAARDAQLDQEWASPVWAPIETRARLGFRYQSGTGGPWGRCFLIALPLWAIISPCALALMGIAIRAARVRVRSRRGACAACGYDLRATPQRCPECGRAPKETLSSRTRGF